jgi:hypothetical protein
LAEMRFAPSTERLGRLTQKYHRCRQLSIERNRQQKSSEKITTARLALTSLRTLCVCVCVRYERGASRFSIISITYQTARLRMLPISKRRRFRIRTFLSVHLIKARSYLRAYRKWEMYRFVACGTRNRGPQYETWFL